MRRVILIVFALLLVSGSVVALEMSARTNSTSTQYSLLDSKIASLATIIEGLANNLGAQIDGINTALISIDARLTVLEQATPAEAAPAEPVTLVNGVHNSVDCTNSFGVVVNDGADNFFCKFQAASCSAGWTKYNNWTQTAINSCGGAQASKQADLAGYGQCVSVACSGASSCSTGSHTFADTATIETCGYSSEYTSGYVWCGGVPISGVGSCGLSSGTCTATITSIGCY